MHGRVRDCRRRQAVAAQLDAGDRAAPSCSISISLVADDQLVLDVEALHYGELIARTTMFPNQHCSAEAPAGM